MQRGGSTAFPETVRYRVGKLANRRLLAGDWLDCGCADGGYTAALLEGGARRVVGIDVEASRVEDARRLRRLPGAEFHWGRSEDLPFDDDSFDGVFCNEVLEHVDDEVLTLREFRRVLRPGGHLVLMAPNRVFPFEGHGLRISRKRSVPWPVPFIPWLPARLTKLFVEARNYWPRQLRRLIAEQGFVVVELGSALPVFEVSPWLPRAVIHMYQQHVADLDTMPLVRRIGVSVFIVARKPGSVG